MSDIPYDTFKMLLARMKGRKFFQNGKILPIEFWAHLIPKFSKVGFIKLFFINPPPNYRLICAPTTQNIYLPEGFCEELKSCMTKVIMRYCSW